MIRFVEPEVSYHRSWLDAAKEFAALDEYMHGSGLAPDDMPDDQVKGTVFRPSLMRDPEAFSRYCAEMRERRLTQVAKALGLVPDTKLFIIEETPGGSAFVGTLSLRHELNDFLLEEGGHVGYSVRLRLTPVDLVEIQTAAKGSDFIVLAVFTLGAYIA